MFSQTFAVTEGGSAQRKEIRRARFYHMGLWLSVIGVVALETKINGAVRTGTVVCSVFIKYSKAVMVVYIAAALRLFLSPSNKSQSQNGIPGTTTLVLLPRAPPTQRCYFVRDMNVARTLTEGLPQQRGYLNRGEVLEGRRLPTPPSVSPTL